jgi:hypothetical protein
MATRRITGLAAGLVLIGSLGVIMGGSGAVSAASRSAVSVPVSARLAVCPNGCDHMGGIQTHSYARPMPNCTTCGSRGHISAHSYVQPLPDCTSVQCIRRDSIHPDLNPQPLPPHDRMIAQM